MNIFIKILSCTIFGIFVHLPSCYAAHATTALNESLASILNVKEQLENSLQNSHLQPATQKEKKQLTEEEKKAIASTLLFNLPSCDLLKNTDTQAPIVIQPSNKILMIKTAPPNQVPSDEEEEDKPIIKKKKRQIIKQIDEQEKTKSDECEDKTKNKDDKTETDKTSDKFDDTGDKPIDEGLS